MRQPLFDIVLTAVASNGGEFDVKVVNRYREGDGDVMASVVGVTLAEAMSFASGATAAYFEAVLNDRSN